MVLRSHSEPSLADSGPGIPADALPHIFEPFYRVEGTRPGGLGIGLATVHRVVEAHGGQVELDTAPGAGTRVRVSLPSPAEPE